jgi:hypothetical protein
MQPKFCNLNCGKEAKKRERKQYWFTFYFFELRWVAVRRKGATTFSITTLDPMILGIMTYIKTDSSS